MLAVWFVVGLGWSLVQTPAGPVVNRSSSESDRPAHFSAQFALSHGCWPIPWLGFFERDRVKRIGKPVKLRIANRINHRVSRRKAFRRQSVALGIKEVTTAPRSRWQNACAERLASSGWYSAQSTVVSDAFLIEFPDDYLYMYRGYTDKDYRGARLHGFGMAEAARIAQRQGKRGLIGLVEARTMHRFDLHVVSAIRRTARFLNSDSVVVGGPPRHLVAVESVVNWCEETDCCADRCCIA